MKRDLLHITSPDLNAKLYALKSNAQKFVSYQERRTFSKDVFRVSQVRKQQTAVHNEIKYRFFIGENVTCAENEFTCRNGECVLAKWKCDAEADCLDSSDEEHCGKREWSLLMGRRGGGGC